MTSCMRHPSDSRRTINPRRRAAAPPRRPWTGQPGAADRTGNSASAAGRARSEALKRRHGLRATIRCPPSRCRSPRPRPWGTVLLGLPAENDRRAVSSPLTSALIVVLGLHKHGSGVLDGRAASSQLGRFMLEIPLPLPAFSALPFRVSGQATRLCRASRSERIRSLRQLRGPSGANRRWTCGTSGSRPDAPR